MEERFDAVDPRHRQPIIDAFPAILDHQPVLGSGWALWVLGLSDRVQHGDIDIFFDPGTSPAELWSAAGSVRERLQGLGYEVRRERKADIEQLTVKDPRRDQSEEVRVELCRGAKLDRSYSVRGIPVTPPERAIGFKLAVTFLRYAPRDYLDIDGVLRRGYPPHRLAGYLRDTYAALFPGLLENLDGPRLASSDPRSGRLNLRVAADRLRERLPLALPELRERYAVAEPELAALRRRLVGFADALARHQPWPVGLPVLRHRDVDRPRRRTVRQVGGQKFVAPVRRRQQRRNPRDGRSR